MGGMVSCCHNVNINSKKKQDELKINLVLLSENKSKTNEKDQSNIPRQVNSYNPNNNSLLEKSNDEIKITDENNLMNKKYTSSHNLVGPNKKLSKVNTEFEIYDKNKNEFKMDHRVKSKRSYTVKDFFIDYKKLQAVKLSSFTKVQLEKLALVKPTEENEDPNESFYDNAPVSQMLKLEFPKNTLENECGWRTLNEEQMNSNTNELKKMKKSNKSMPKKGPKRKFESTTNANNKEQNHILRVFNNPHIASRKSSKNLKNSMKRKISAANVINSKSKYHSDLEKMDFIKKILIEDEMITNEMPDDIIKKIINSFVQVKINSLQFIASFNKCEPHEDILITQMNNVCGSPHRLPINDPNLQNSIISLDTNRKNNNSFLSFDKIQNSEYYIIVIKGIIEMYLDGVIYTLIKENSISIKALETNTKQSSYLKTLKKVMLYQIKLHEYYKIFNEFIDKLNEEKTTFLKKNLLFLTEEKKIMEYIINRLNKVKFNERKMILKEDDVLSSFYFVYSGEIECVKDDKVIKTLYKNSFIGTLNYLISEQKSLFNYYANKDSELYQIDYNTLNQIYDLPICCQNSMRVINFNIKNCDKYGQKNIIKNIFLNAVNNSFIFSKYFNKENFPQFLNIFSLKYYNDNEIICDKNNAKLILPLDGYFILNKSNDKNDEKIDLSSDNSIMTPDGNFYEDFLFKNGLKNKELIIKSESFCLMLEAAWNKVLKSIKFYINPKYTLYDLIKILSKIDALSHLSDMKLLYLAENLKIIKYKKKELIYKNDNIYERIYIIISGDVSIIINNVEVAEKSHPFYFGTALLTKEERKNKSSSSNLKYHSMHSNKSYNEKSSYYAKSEVVECFYFDKDIYDEINTTETFDSILKSHIETDVYLKDLYYLKELGEGAFGKVYLVHDKKRLYALKSAEINSELLENKKFMESYTNEKKILSTLQHPFIVKLVNTYKTNNFLIFLLEFVRGVTLKNFIEANYNLRNIEVIKFISGILCMILTYLQKRRILYRDLKPSNIMIDHEGYIKLIDFGTAKNMSGLTHTTSVVGTPQYMCPEILSGQKYSWGADIWSLGINLYQIFYGQFPFGISSNNMMTVYKEIQENKIVFPSDQKLEDVNEFINSLLNKNHSKRVNNFYKWKYYKLFSGYDFDKLYKKEMESPIFKVIKSKSNKNLSNLKNGLSKGDIDNNDLLDLFNNEYSDNSNNWSNANLFITFLNGNIVEPFDDKSKNFLNGNNFFSEF